MPMGGKRSSCVGLNLGFELLDHLVAFARRGFQVHATPGFSPYSIFIQ